MTHPWQAKFTQCIPSIDEATQALHVKFDRTRAASMNQEGDWKGLEAMLLDLADQLKRRNSRHAKSLNTLVWALWEVFPYKSS